MLFLQGSETKMSFELPQQCVFLIQCGPARYAWVISRNRHVFGYTKMQVNIAQNKYTLECLLTCLISLYHKSYLKRSKRNNEFIYMYPLNFKSFRYIGALCVYVYVFGDFSEYLLYMLYLSWQWLAIKTLSDTSDWYSASGDKTVIEIWILLYHSFYFWRYS